MANQSKKSNNKSSKPDFDAFLEQLNGSENDGLRKIWNESEALNEPELDISEDETEAALARVHQKLRLVESKAPEKQSGTDRPKAKSNDEQIRNTSFFSMGWALLAAAILVMAFGITYLIYPQKVTVPHGQSQTVALPDGSSIQLNSGSSVAYNRLFGLTNRDISFNGEAFFEVEPGSRAFTVEANGAQISVLGTAFNVRSWSDEPGMKTVVTVTSGEVAFAPTSHVRNQILLTGGLSSNWAAGMEKPSDPVQARLDTILAWRDRNLAFANQPLNVIFKELERKFDVKIEITDANIGDSILTTYYSQPVTVEKVLNDIATVKGLTYSETANGFRISYK